MITQRVLASIVVMLSLPFVSVADPGQRPSPEAIDADQVNDWLAFAWADFSIAAGANAVHEHGLARTIAALARPALGTTTNIGPLGDGLLGVAAVMADADRPTAVWVTPVAQGGEAAAVTVRFAEGTDSPRVEEALRGLQSAIARRDVPDHNGTHARELSSFSPPSELPKPLSRESVGEWPAHRQAARTLQSAGAVVFEFALNVNALRVFYGDAFDSGRGAAMLDTLSLSNARIVGMHGILIPAKDVATRDRSLPRVAGGAAEQAYQGGDLLAIVLTTSARSQPPGTVRAALITCDFWPQLQLGSPFGSPDAWNLAIRTPWRTIWPRVLDVYAAGLMDEQRAVFDRSREAWRSEGGGAADRLAGSLSGYLGLAVATDEHGAAVTQFRVPLREPSSADTLLGIIGKITKPLSEISGNLPGEGLRWRSAAQARWSGLRGSVTLGKTGPEKSAEGSASFVELRGELVAEPIPAATTGP